MAGPESTFWKYTRGGMIGSWDATRHEDRGGTLGIPDVSFGRQNINGWIELKVIPAWPKRKATLVRIDHFTGPQRAFLINRGRLGGSCFLFLKVRDVPEYVLLPWTEVRIDDHQTRGQMLGAGEYWRGRVNWNEFADAIVRPIVPG